MSLRPSTGRSALAVRIGLKLPTGNPALLLGSGAADAGLGLDARYSVGRNFRIYLSAGGVLMGSALRDPNAQRAMIQAFAALEYKPNGRDSFYLQVDGNSLAVRTFNRTADGPQVTATFGYRRLLTRHSSLFAAFSDNGHIDNYALPYFSNVGPDFTLSSGIEWAR